MKLGATDPEIEQRLLTVTATVGDKERFRALCVAKLSGVLTGDTLAPKNQPVVAKGPGSAPPCCPLPSTPRQRATTTSS